MKTFHSENFLREHFKTQFLRNKYSCLLARPFIRYVIRNELKTVYNIGLLIEKEMGVTEKET